MPFSHKHEFSFNKNVRGLGRGDSYRLPSLFEHSFQFHRVKVLPSL